jgi:mono/diheme cytochrome c family protein
MHVWLIVALVVLLPRVVAAQGAPQGAPAGAELYIAKGCLGCHGASGRGGVGPPLADTKLTRDAFLTQLRHPRGIMPSFPETVVSDADAREIQTYLQSVPRPAPRLRADLPHGKQTPASCTPCHRKLHPTIVAQFESSAMGKPGMQNPRVTFPQKQITCANCHGTDHDEIMQTKGRVPETMCATCHGEIYKDAVQDLGHSYGPGPGGLGTNWERNIGVPHYKQMPRKVMEWAATPVTRRPARPTPGTGAKSRRSISTRRA